MTKLSYLDNTYLFESEATFLEVKQNEKGMAIILDETIFYPQWWGQPADTGTISCWENVFVVKDVRLDEEGRVRHFGEYRSGEFASWDRVHLHIHEEKRKLQAKLHSAGHLIDCAVSLLQIPNFHAIKGYHFPDNPYVEFEGSIDTPETILPALQQKIDDLVSQNLCFEKRNLTSDEAKAQGIIVPIGKSARLVNLEWFLACWCGGTHISSTSEIGKLTIRKIKSSQGKTKISYVID